MHFFIVWSSPSRYPSPGRKGEGTGYQEYDSRTRNVVISPHQSIYRGKIGKNQGIIVYSVDEIYPDK
jgi:hypothetical protein